MGALRLPEITFSDQRVSAGVGKEDELVHVRLAQGLGWRVKQLRDWGVQVLYERSAPPPIWMASWERIVEALPS